MTLTLTNFIGLLGGLLVLAFAATRLSRRTRVPDVIVLLGSGILLGPTLHWIDAARFPQVIRGFGTLALILILFAAGLELDLRRALKQFMGGMVLAVLSYGLSLAGVTFFCIHALAMHPLAGLLVAAPLACLSGSIILPVLDQLDLRQDLKTTLVIEASFGDGLGALGVGVLLDIAAGGGATTRGVLPSILALVGLKPGSGGSILSGVFALFLFQFLLAFAVALIAGFLWVRLLPLISDKQFWQVLTFAAVLLIYSGTHALGGSDLFAVMVFGATLANMPDPQDSRQEFGFEILPPGHSDRILSFHSELAFLVRSFFFVLLGAMIEFGGLRKELLPSLGILGVFLLARVIAVTGSRVAWRGTSARERELAILLIPRGLITAVLALEVVEAMPVELAFLTSVAFALILFTNVLVLLASIRAQGLPAAQPAPFAAPLAAVSAPAPASDSDQTPHLTP
jgi:NhaP-type Na+/H+ or K+/H+ antiporter